MDIIGGIRGAFAAAGGAAFALVLFLIWNTVWDNPQQYADGKSEGAAQERIVWEELRRRNIAQIEETKRKAQADLDDLEQKFFDASRRASAAEARQAVQEEIKALPNKDEPVLPKRAAGALNRVGRHDD